MLKRFAQSIPTDSVNLVFNTILAIWDALVTDLAVPFLTDIGETLFFIFVTVAPTIGFMLLIALFLFMFHIKFIGPIGGLGE